KPSFAKVASRLGFAELLSLQPRYNVLANLLRLYPGVVESKLLLARRPLLFVPMLLLFMLALGLITLYVNATTAHEEIVAARARFVAAAAGHADIPPEMLEERALVLTHELRSPLTAILGYAGL